jgi:predicted Zn-dependent protease with MMP-like domain
MRLTQEEFHDLVLQAVQELPPRIMGAMENVAILVEDWPSKAVLEATGVESRYGLLGLYSGVPLPAREGGPPLLPDTITLFQGPIESACPSLEAVVSEIRVTLLHEVGHYMGMDEEDLERMGYR